LTLSLNYWEKNLKIRRWHDFFRLANLASVLYPKETEAKRFRRDQALTKDMSFIRRRVIYKNLLIKSNGGIKMQADKDLRKKVISRAVRNIKRDTWMMKQHEGCFERRSGWIFSGLA